MVVETRAKRRQRQEILDRFPEELIEEILKRLPVRSLVRFSCTCKRWRSLIFSDSKFNKSHLDHAKRPSWKLHGIHNPGYPIVDCACSISSPLIKTIWRSPAMLGCCNGLLFVRNWGVSDSKDGPYSLWNPYTNSVGRVTRLEVQGIDDEMCGLSYDRVNDDYKAVVVALHYPGKQSAFMFSLRRNSWKKLSDLTFGITLSIDLGYDRCGVTPDDGICYWQIKQVPGKSSIICFDPVVETFKKVPLPNEWSRQFQIGALDGCLSLVHINNIWVMKEYGCWTKLHVLPLSYVEQMGEINTYKPLGYNKNKDQMLLIARGHQDLNWQFWIADLSKGVLMKPSDEGLRFTVCALNLVPYSESLLCPWVGHSFS